MLTHLEDFASPQSQTKKTPVSETPGYEAGFVAGRTAALAEGEKLEAALLQHFDDLAFGFAEARQHLLAALQPCIGALVQRLLPETTEDRFLAELQDIILSAAAKDLQQPVKLFLSPAQADAVRDILIKHGIAGFAILSDAATPPNTAIIRTDQRETALDIDALTGRLTDILASLSFAQTKDKKHG